MLTDLLIKRAQEVLAAIQSAEVVRVDDMTHDVGTRIDSITGDPSAVALQCYWEYDNEDFHLEFTEDALAHAMIVGNTLHIVAQPDGADPVGDVVKFDLYNLKPLKVTLSAESYA